VGKRGPRKQPTALRIARGNPGNRPLNKLEPKPADSSVTPPDWIVGVARAKWDDVVPKLQAMRVMTTADVEPIARYCAMYEQWVKYLEQMRRGLDVIVMRDKDGKVRYMQSSPAATMFVKLAASMLRIEQEFGLTPSARTGVETVNGETDEEAKLRAFTG
jgi:P27 family predicted phage terminase small subunit